MIEKQLSLEILIILINMKNQLQQSTLDTFQQSKTISFDVQKQINDKYRTFTKFNERTVLQEMRKARKKKVSKAEDSKNNDVLKNLLSFAFNLKDVQTKKPLVQELAGIKSQRRQRFKKATNPLQIIQHYTEKEHFHPRDEEKYLLTQLIEIRSAADKQGSNIDLDRTLKSKSLDNSAIYKLMNEAVDYNEMRFLGLLILLAADICFEVKDFRRAMYFYNETRMLAAYSNMPSIKMDALAAMAHVAMELRVFDQAILLLKKSLQYAWKTKNIECQLLIYDSIGSCLYNQGSVKNANYFHRRFSQGEAQRADSAIKKISAEMLAQYQRYINSLQTQNLTSLFLEYINVPISNFESVAPAVKHRQIYENYDDNGQSPRVRKINKPFQLADFVDAKTQIERILGSDKEFQTEIPNPDVQNLFEVPESYGRRRNNKSFQQSPDYHKIVGIPTPKLNFEKIYKYSIDRQVERLKKDQPNTQWWQEMKDKLKKQQIQKVGQLKDKIRISHLSYGKFPEERRRAQSLKHQKIKESFNVTMLNWIDPVK